MLRRKADYIKTPEEIFLERFSDEQYKSESVTLTLKIEKLPAYGRMDGHVIKYLPANRFVWLEEQIRDAFGPGIFFLRFVDDDHKPLEW